MPYAEFVYVISGDHGRQKIGVSNNPKARLRELQTGSPFPLAFEFVGLAEDGTAYAIEAEAHFLLNEHRQTGEWFTVPPEMAIAAVMGAARRIGRSLKPVDPNAVEAVAAIQPLWQKLLVVPIALAFAWFGFWPALAAFNAGELSGLSFVIVALVLIVSLKAALWVARRFCQSMLALWQGWQDLMHPEGGEKVPLDL
jgi:hypothetical protein